MPEINNKSEYIWPPELPVKNVAVSQENGNAKWTFSRVLAGIITGFLFSALIYVIFIALGVGTEIYLAIHPTIASTIFYHLISGITSVLDILCLVGPIALFWWFRKSRIAYASGIMVGGILATMAAVHMNHMLAHSWNFWAMLSCKC